MYPHVKSVSIGQPSQAGVPPKLPAGEGLEIARRMEMIRTSVLLAICGMILAAGCNGSNALYTTEDRLDKGLVIILPGIEGESELNHNIRRGLVMAGLDCALPIYSWGRPIPGVGMILNQVDFIGNRLAGVRIAKSIEQYQQDHPGRPVYVIGHSGGGGVAVFVAEGMTEGKQIDGLVLLSASLSAGYDLTKALSRCKNGIANFYNEGDVGLLGVGTMIAGNVDGVHGPSCGLNGFDKLPNNASQEKKLAYLKLHQINMSYGMTGGGDPHTAVTRPGFVSLHIAPWVSGGPWPAGAALRPSQTHPPLRKLAKAFDSKTAN